MLPGGHKSVKELQRLFRLFGDGPPLLASPLWINPVYLHPADHPQGSCTGAGITVDENRAHVGVTDGSHVRRKNLILSGILMSLVNPYWSIWWATIGLGYILHSMNAGTMGVVAFFTGHILGDLFWYAAVSTAIWKGRQLLSDRGYRILIGTCAACLIVFSCLFAWSGMQKLIA